MCGTFCDLPGRLRNDFGRLGVGWFKTYFQHIREDVASGWVWERQLFGCSELSAGSWGVSILLADAVLSRGKRPPSLEEMWFREITK